MRALPPSPPAHPYRPLHGGCRGASVPPACKAAPGVVALMDALAHLAADGVMPVWLAHVYGVPLHLGYRGTAVVAPTAHARTQVRVPYVAWSRAEAALGPRALRHGLALSVARLNLMALPSEWEALAVRSSRRTPRGKEWARKMAREGYLKGVPRPDGEWWPPSIYRDPLAVEIDTGKLDPWRVWERWDKWRIYSGVIWVVLSPHRAEVVGELMDRWLQDRPGLRGRWRVLWLKAWWEGNAYVWVR